MAKIKVENTEISVVNVQNEDYISLTDMAHSQMQEHIIFRWMSLKSTIEYLGEWEMLYNPNFNCTEFDTIKNAAGSNNFVLSVKAWIQRTGAIGIMAKAGRYGGTYAHRDIAYHFGMWISPRFQLLLVKEYQRLKADEQKQLAWSAKRELSKINYRIHTDAIKENLIPDEVTREQAAMKYADEADVLNIAMFGMTRKITLAAARIAQGLQDKLYLGNLDSLRDWGYAKDYVECMWLILQAPKPEDFVIATGVQHSVREFAQLAFHYVGIELKWEGKDENEKGICVSGPENLVGKTLVEVSPDFYRPTDVVNLWGDPTKAKAKLGWNPNTTSFEELVKIMVDHDMAKVASEGAAAKVRMNLAEYLEKGIVK